MREQRVLRFYIRLRVTFFNPIYLELTRKEGNSGAVLISPAFWNPLTRSLGNGVLKEDILDV